MLRTTQDNTIISPVVVTHRQGDQADVIKVSNKEAEDMSIKVTSGVSISPFLIHDGVEKV